MKKILSALALAACAFSANAALVATGNLTLNNFEYTPAVTGATLTISPFNYSNTTISGVEGTFTAASLNGGLPIADILLFCIELPRPSASFGSGASYPLHDAPLMANGGLMDAGRLGKLTELFEDYSLAPATAVASAAMQLAVWEVIYENGSTMNVGSGNFSAPTALNWGNVDLASAKAAANQMFADLDGIYGGQLYSFNNFGNKGGLQDFIAYKASGTFGCNDVDCGGTVPEPGSMALAASAMLGLGIVGRRRKLKVVSE